MKKTLRRNNRQTAIVAVPRAFSPPEMVRVKLRYAQNQLLTSSASTSAITQQMRLNSTFDPDATGAGHQPMYYDNYSAIYTNYRVIASHIRVTFVPNPTSDAGLIGPYVIGIVGSPVSTNPSTTPTDRQEMPDSVHKVVSRYDTPNVLTLDYTPLSKLGQDGMDDVLAAAVASSPSQQYYANVWFADLTGPASSLMTASIVVEYTVEFFKLAQQTQN